MILVIEIDDDINSQEKIFLIKGDRQDDDKYSPILKIEDFNRVYYKIILEALSIYENNRE